MPSVKSEFYKKQLLLQTAITIVFLVLVYLWLIMDNMNAKPETLAVGWNCSLFDIPVLNVILCPIYLTVLTNRMIEPDHKGDMYKLLFTLQSRNRYYHCKLLLGLMQCVLFSLGQSLTMIVICWQYHFTQTCPWNLFLLNTLLTIAVTYAGFLLILALTLLFKNPAFPISVGIASSLIGLFLCLCASPLIRHLFFWTNYTTLSLFSMEYDEASATCIYTQLPLNGYGILAVLVFGILFYLTGAYIMHRKEY